MFNHAIKCGFAAKLQSEMYPFQHTKTSCTSKKFPTVIKLLARIEKLFDVVGTPYFVFL